MDKFPCQGCEHAASCCQVTGHPCHLLHKFLREDKKCHTRVQTTELLVSPEFITMLSDQQQANPTRLTWQDCANATPGYWDIELAKHLTAGEKAMISSFYIDGLSYKQIAEKYQISYKTVERQLIKIKKHLRKVCTLKP